MASNKDLNRLKVILAEKKKSNLWLSKQLGCAPTTVSKWCTNSSQPPLESLMKITRLLNVELNDLVRYEELDKEVVRLKQSRTVIILNADIRILIHSNL